MVLTFLRLYNTDGYRFDVKYGGEYEINDATIEGGHIIDISINYFENDHVATSNRNRGVRISLTQKLTTLFIKKSFLFFFLYSRILHAF